MSRSIPKNIRIYIDGYDMSGYARSVGPLTQTYEEGTDDALSLSVKRTWPGQASVGIGTVNALFDNTATSGIHAVLGTAGGTRTVLVAMGMEAAPVDNVPCFGGKFIQSDYVSAPSETPVALTLTFNSTSATTETSLYSNPWGVLLHASAAATGANTATGHDGAAQSLVGGFMVYHVTTAAGTGDITATFKVQDADTNSDGSFSDLLTSGVINCGSSGVAVPTSGIVALAPTATVERYTRWQIVLGTASSVTFTLGFFRNYHN